MGFSGGISDYFVAFWGGVVVSFSPCIYPVIPIVAGLIAGANTKGTKLMGFIISLVYVLGLSITYSILAIVAALSGKMFGQVQSSPIIYFIVAGFLIFFGLAMLKVVRLGSFGFNFQSKLKPVNIGTIFLTGMASGLAVSPCTAPILATLLLYVASKQNIIHAASLTFVFSYGVGASLIIVGTFSGILSRMPKSGPWLLRIQQFAGFILLIVAGFFLIKGLRLF